MKHATVYSVYFAVIAVLLLCGCRKQKGTTMLSEREMEELLYDYHCAHALARLSKDSASYLDSVYSKAVLEKYNLTAEEFDSAMAYYGRNTTRLANIYRRIDMRIETEISMLGENASATANFDDLPTSGDTANIWNGHSVYVLATPGLQNRVDFKIDADSLLRAGDRFEWHFNTHFVLPKGGREAVASLTIRYSDGTTQARTMRMANEREFGLRIDAKTDHTPVSIEGFLYLPGAWGEKQKLLIMTRPRLVRIHTKKEITMPADSIPADTLVVPVDTTRTDSLPPEPHLRPKARRKSRI